MPAYNILDFKSGLDLRKSYVTAPAGSLRTLRNAFVTAGAEIEKRSAFMQWGIAPPGTLGPVAYGGVIYLIRNGPSAIIPQSGTTFGSITPSILQVPYPAGSTITGLADWDVFNGKFYLVLAGPHGYAHYYNQVRVTDAMATSSSIRTYGTKMYGVDGRLLRFSAINDPTKWTPPISPLPNDGSGYIDLSAQDSDFANLVGLEAYYGQLAVFSNKSVQLWAVDPDPAQNQFKQILRQAGLLATNAVTQFGSGDVMFLSSHGVRSLRAQNLTLTAGVTDLGTPIDEVVRQLIIDNGAVWFQQARCLIQPRGGRLFLVLNDRIYVLSTFQEPPITAWSMFDAPFKILDACADDPWVVLRGDDGKIYLYGNDIALKGTTAVVYDNTEVEVITPALSCESPARTKLFHSFDVGAEGTWTLSVGCDANNQATEETVATFTGPTYVNQTMTMPEWSTHISLRFRSTDPTRARLGNVVLMFDEGSQN